MDGIVREIAWTIRLLPMSSERSPARKSRPCEPSKQAAAAQGAAAAMIILASIFRDDRTAELEIKPDRHDRERAIGRVRQLSVHRESRERASGPVVAHEVVIAVLELGPDVV